MNDHWLQILKEIEGDARNVEEAIDVLTGDGKKVDKHPEKRMKAAFNGMRVYYLPCFFIKKTHSCL